MMINTFDFVLFYHKINGLSIDLPGSGVSMSDLRDALSSYRKSFDFFRLNFFDVTHS